MQTDEENAIKPILVLASWSSGSTAITGFLDKCGAYTCPPHQETNDSLTPLAYESAAYGKALRQLFNEATLKQMGRDEDFKSFFTRFWYDECRKARAAKSNHIVLKHPLQSLILPYLDTFLSPDYILVTRPFENIEKTRVRRRWLPIYGRQGAQIIYSTTFNFLIDNKRAFLSVPYDGIIKNMETRQRLIDYCGLTPTQNMLTAAGEFLRE
jgi:hypothetical protein